MLTTLNGRRVAYEDAGEGLPLVLIHGYPLNRMMWEPQLEGLADAARVIAPDLRGFGESEAIAGTTTIGAFADDVRELLEALGVTEPAVICGLSMGGYIAFEFFRRYPGHTAALILANTKAGPDSVEGKAGRDQSAALAQAQGAGAIAEALLPKMLAPQSYANAELVERVKRIMSSASVTGIVGALRAMKERPDSTSTLAEFRQPALVLAGADDALIPPSEAEALAKALPNARLVTLHAAGHLSNLEQPASFNRAVAEFLAAML